MTSRAGHLDPTGARHGIPTYPRRMAPAHLATRNQIREMGFRPVAGPVAQLMWPGAPGRRRPGESARTAALFDLAATVQRTPASLARHEQLADARARQRICPDCHRDVGYVIPARYGACLDCHDTPTRRTHAA